MWFVCFGAFAAFWLGLITTMILAWAGPWMLGTTPSLNTAPARTLVAGERLYAFMDTRSLLVRDCWLVRLDPKRHTATNYPDDPIASFRDLPSWSPEPGSEAAFIAQAGGFPFRALKRVQRDIAHEHSINPQVEWGLGKNCRLPTGMIWPGFLADMVFWGIAWAALFAAPGRIVRRRRLRQGHCAACGYDLAGAGALCPECGASR